MSKFSIDFTKEEEEQLLYLKYAYKVKHTNNLLKFLIKNEYLKVKKILDSRKDVKTNENK
jgi:hypothetical protein